jgi:hypothetical protein
MGTSYGADSVTNGLILSLDAGDKNSYGGSGSTWYDLCGNNDTTINGATYNSGGYFVLDGTNDYFQVTDDGSSDFAKQTFSIELWCYVVANNLGLNYTTFWSYDYTSHDSPYHAQHFRTYNRNNTPYYTLYAASNRDGNWSSSPSWPRHWGPSYIPNKWTHLVWTLGDGGTTKISTLYQDGSSLETETLTSWSDITYYNQEVWIGKGNLSSFYYEGNIATVKFYDRALSSQEVTQNFNAHRNRFGV